jgi:hypothetical protein
MKKGTRIVVLIVCTVTSIFGGLMGAVLLFGMAGRCDASDYHDPSCVFGGSILYTTLIAYLFAWIVYLIMGAAWVGESGIPRWLPIAGTAAALSYFLPVVMFSNLGLGGNLAIIGTDLLLVSPAIVLAIVLVRYHLVKRSSVTFT